MLVFELLWIVFDRHPDDMRDGAAAARVAHNHEVVGSSPTPATKKRDLSF